LGIIVAGLWGFAEATLFFIVPDVWLTRLAITHSRVYALKAALLTSIGALLGGCVMIMWSSLDVDMANQWVASVPGISPAVMDRVAAQLNNEGLLALFFAPFVGVPYKTFAVQVYHSDVALWSFLLATVPARLSRFILTVWFCAWLAEKLRRVVRERTIFLLWGGFWVIFYIQYFYSMANN
jgi:membrane protein YqaA with SNARE-associated domain